MAKTWFSHGPSNWFLLNHAIVRRDTPCQFLHCWLYPVAPFSRNGQNMPFSWPKHGPHMFLLIVSSWILIIMPRDVPCQISRYWVYPIAPFPGNGQKMALLWPKHGHHLVLPIGSSWILVIVPSDVPCQMSHCWVYPVAHFPRNGRIWPFMAKTWSSTGP